MRIKTTIAKVNKTIGILRIFQRALLRPSLATIYKSFVRPHLDYGDIIFDQALSNSFYQRMEYIQDDAALAKTGAIKSTLKERPYQKLSFESLESWRWSSKLSFFTKQEIKKHRSIFLT